MRMSYCVEKPDRRGFNTYDRDKCDRGGLTLVYLKI